MGFDDSNDFSGWSGYEGNNQNSNAALTLVTGPITPNNLVNPGEYACSYFGLVNSGTDPLMGFSLTSPLGGYAAKLGGEYRNLGQGSGGCETALSGSDNNTAGEVLERTFTVSNSNAFLQYCFAFVYFDDGSHANGSQPYFKVDVLDSTGTLIPCFAYYQQGLSGVAPVGYESNATAYQNTYSTPGYYINSIDVSAYTGHPITLRFTVAGCALTAHFGYAYVDAKCNPRQVITASKPLCVSGDTTVLSGPTGYYSYTWTGPVSGNTQTIKTGTPGTYTLVASTYTGCTPPPFYYTVTKGSFSTLSVTATNDSICTGASSTLTASGATTYTWSSNASSATTNTVSVSPIISTTYTVIGTDNNGCVDTTKQVIHINNCTTGINDLKVSDEVKVYPNPANNVLYVSCKAKGSVLYITDLLGNKVKQVHADTELSTVDLSDLNEGVYFLNIKTTGNLLIKKFVVQH